MDDFGDLNRRVAEGEHRLIETAALEVLLLDVEHAEIHVYTWISQGDTPDVLDMRTSARARRTTDGGVVVVRHAVGEVPPD